ncbi:MAG: outer membrane beta-barrel protein [Thiotrichales bacterium]
MNSRPAEVTLVRTRRPNDTLPSLAMSVACLCLLAALTMPQPAMAVGPIFDRSWFVGAGVGSSSMKPDLSDTPLQLEKRQSTGFKLAAGIDIDHRWSAEAFYTDLGAALLGYPTELGRSSELAYRVMGAGVVVALPDNRPGASVLLKGGIANISTKTDAAIGNLDGLQGYLGIGGSVQFPNGYAVRGEYEYYGKDTDLLSLSLIKRFGLDAAQRAEVRRAQALLPPPATLPRFAEATPDVLATGRPPLPLRGADRPLPSDRLLQPELPDDLPPVEFQALAEPGAPPATTSKAALPAAVSRPAIPDPTRVRPPMPAPGGGITFQTLADVEPGRWPGAVGAAPKSEIRHAVTPPPLHAPGLRLQSLDLPAPAPAPAPLAKTAPVAIAPESSVLERIPPQSAGMTRLDPATPAAIPVLKIRANGSGVAQESRVVMVTFDDGGRLSKASLKAVEAAADAVLERPGLEVILATGADQVADAARLLTHVRTLGGALQARGVPISRIFVLGVRRGTAAG